MGSLFQAPGQFGLRFLVEEVAGVPDGMRLLFQHGAQLVIAVAQPADSYACQKVHIFLAVHVSDMGIVPAVQGDRIPAVALHDMAHIVIFNCLKGL